MYVVVWFTNFCSSFGLSFVTKLVQDWRINSSSKFFICRALWRLSRGAESREEFCSNERLDSTDDRVELLVCGRLVFCSKGCCVSGFRVDFWIILSASWRLSSPTRFVNVFSSSNHGLVNFSSTNNVLKKASCQETHTAPFRSSKSLGTVSEFYF